MRQEEIFANEGGINGSPTGEVDTTRSAFFLHYEQRLRLMQQNKRLKLKKNMALRVLHIKMREYFESTEITDAISIGDWLNKYLKVLKIKVL